jgi:A/G-specific adenine glycosylase
MGGKSSESRAAHRLRRERNFQSRLLRWFDKHGRDLPWRRTRDPYHILVSEVMLQQTQVRRVEAYYHRFLASFPTLPALARAAPARVREAWDGLGYYRRSEHLHRLARQVMTEHQGRIPDDVERLRGLPGVGRYTAGAILSFAFERPAAAVDTNVARVIRRAFLPRTGAARAVGDRRIWAVAERLLPRSGPRIWAFNQAIMELGALVCTARVARCGECPVRAVCGTGRKSVNGKR